MVDTKDAVFCGTFLALGFEKLFKCRDMFQEILDGKNKLPDILDGIYYYHTPDYKTCICTISLFGFQITSSHFNATGDVDYEEISSLAFEDACEKARGLIAFAVKVIDDTFPTGKELFEKGFMNKCSSDKAKSDEATLSKHIFVVKM